jgi:hypothetical protein
MARPLTRVKKKTSETYTRPADVEAQIDRVLALGFPEVLRRARVTDRASPDYLYSECLVHFVREARRTGRDRESEALLLLLLERCGANLRRTIRQDGVPNTQQLRDEILQHLAMMFAEDAVEGGTWLDYYECRFNRAFAALRIDIYNREVGQVNRSVPETTESGEEIADDSNSDDRTGADFCVSSRLEDHVYAKQVAAFLRTLPLDEYQAVVLCRLMNLTQEDAAKRLRVSVKTIYNRLTRADLKLARLKEDA